MMKNISILGSTGSIGRQALEVAAHLGISVKALTANTGVKLLEEQARRFKPGLAVCFDESAAADLKVRLRDTGTKVLAGMDGLTAAATVSGIDMVLTSVVGMIGLIPTLEAINHKIDIALANKETLVCAGELVTRRARERGVKILPVDSEHSAVFQAVDGKNPIKRIILTASGGPFYGFTSDDLKKVTLSDALKHPNWQMGKKITVDSATLMNKGLEYIEAIWLFGVEPSQIEVVVHRESIIHSAVEYMDNSVIAQLSPPDMRLPIQYALTYPHRAPGITRALDFLEYGSLTFSKPDCETFPCLKMAMAAAKTGGTAGAILNASNEAAVELFLAGKIRFTEISQIVSASLDKIKVIKNPTVDEILETDKEVRETILKNQLEKGDCH